MLKFYTGFEINDHTGESLTDYDMTEAHYEKITSLQRAVFKNYKSDGSDFSMSNVASVDTRESLYKNLKKFRYIFILFYNRFCLNFVLNTKNMIMVSILDNCHVKQNLQQKLNGPYLFLLNKNPKICFFFFQYKKTSQHSCLLKSYTRVKESSRG